MIDTVIKGGTVVTPAGVGSWDIGLEGEKIAAVTMPGVLSTEGVRIVDVIGKQHVHCTIMAVHSHHRNMLAHMPDSLFPRDPTHHDIGGCGFLLFPS